MKFPQPWIEVTVLEKLAQVSNDCFWFSSSTRGFEVHMAKGKAVQVVAVSLGTNQALYDFQPNMPIVSSELVRMLDNHNI